MPNRISQGISNAAGMTKTKTLQAYGYLAVKSRTLYRSLKGEKEAIEIPL